MATAEQLKALIRSHAAGDDDRFYSVAMQVAARAAQQGHGRYARDLKALVDRSRDNPDLPHAGAQAGRTKQAQALPAELAGILTMRHPGTLLQEMVLAGGAGGAVGPGDQRATATAPSGGVWPEADAQTAAD